MSIHTVFSISDNAYCRWMAELLAWSHKAAGQPGKLTALVAGGTDARDYGFPAYVTPSYSPHPVTGDEYLAYNKPGSILHWIEPGGICEDTIVVIDPDFVFLHPLEVRAVAGVVQAPYAWYLDPSLRKQVWDGGFDPSLLTRFCPHPERLPRMAPPYVFERADLRRIAPAWLHLTEQIRSDQQLSAALGWEAEMWALAMAVADAPLEFVPRADLANFGQEHRCDLPLMHYYQAMTWPQASWQWVEDGWKWAVPTETSWRWSKQEYRPWDLVESPP